MMKVTLHVVAIAAALLAVACGTPTPQPDGGATTGGGSGAGGGASGGGGGASGGGGGTATGGGAGDAGVVVPGAAELIEQVATAQCGALERCCKDSDRVGFFGSFAQDNSLSPVLRARIPMDGRIDAAACRALLRDVYAIKPLGSWLKAVSAGRVEFKLDEVQTCLATLNNAACGRPVTDALFDSTCFAFSPPIGGDEQRKIFRRTATAGATCNAIADGFGGIVYGTCNPAQAFCCKGTDAGCGPLALDGGTGTCVAASQVGQRCEISPLQWCATGLDCSSSTGRCVAPVTTPLPVDAGCAAGSELLGVCVDSWCDFFNSNKCLAKKADGAACQDNSECTSGACNQAVCGPFSFCAAP